MSKMNDFQIENGKLIKYTGADRHVEIPSSVTSIESFAFRWCSDVESIYIPASVNSIGYYAASHCCSLEKLEVDKNNPKYFSKGNCVIDSERGALVLGCQSSIIPDDGSVTSISDFAFAGCVALDSITIPCPINKIWDYAFDGCYNLESIALPDSLSYIGSHVFDGCENLESIVIPDSVTYIADYAFSDCYNLKSLTATDSLIGLGVNVFAGCSDAFVITASSDSYIEEYANKSGIKVQLI